MNSAWPYTISNPLTPDGASRSHRGEYFDLMGRVRRPRYSEVSWDHEKMVLPPRVMKEFWGEIMAITGFEVDLVRRDGAHSWRSVPCYEQYNHHFTGWLYGWRTPNAKRQVEANRTQREWEARGGVPCAACTPPGVEGEMLTMHMISEGNGNEARRTLRAMPRGYAYLVYSPVMWVNVPMARAVPRRAEM